MDDFYNQTFAYLFSYLLKQHTYQPILYLSNFSTAVMNFHVDMIMLESSCAKHNYRVFLRLCIRYFITINNLFYSNPLFPSKFKSSIYMDYHYHHHHTQYILLIKPVMSLGYQSTWGVAYEYVCYDLINLNHPD